MGTVNKEFADNIAKHNGWYNGDSDNSLGDNPQVICITRYENAFGGVGYGLTFFGQHNKYLEETEFVRNPIIYWEATL